VEENILFRVKIKQGKVWIFVCKTCCEESKLNPYYIYGGTWKG
jgi:hypothetical protein